MANLFEMIICICTCIQAFTVTVEAKQVQLQPYFRGWKTSDTHVNVHKERENPLDLTGVIIGCSIGGVILLALAITCCVCICVKYKSRPSRIVAPKTAGPTVIMSQSHQQTNGYAYPAMPEYPYVTGHAMNSTNPGIQTSARAVPPAPLLHHGPLEGALPVVGGENSAITK